MPSSTTSLASCSPAPASPRMQREEASMGTIRALEHQAESIREGISAVEQQANAWKALIDTNNAECERKKKERAAMEGAMRQSMAEMEQNGEHLDAQIAFFTAEKKRNAEKMKETRRALDTHHANSATRDADDEKRLQDYHDKVAHCDGELAQRRQQLADAEKALEKERERQLSRLQEELRRDDEERERRRREIHEQLAVLAPRGTRNVVTAKQAAQCIHIEEEEEEEDSQPSCDDLPEQHLLRASEYEIEMEEEANHNISGAEMGPMQVGTSQQQPTTTVGKRHGWLPLGQKSPLRSPLPATSSGGIRRRSTMQTTHAISPFWHLNDSEYSRPVVLELRLDRFAERAGSGNDGLLNGYSEATNIHGLLWRLHTHRADLLGQEESSLNIGLVCEGYLAEAEPAVAAEEKDGNPAPQLWNCEVKATLSVLGRRGPVDKGLVHIFCADRPRLSLFITIKTFLDPENGYLDDGGSLVLRATVEAKLPTLAIKCEESSQAPERFSSGRARAKRAATEKEQEPTPMSTKSKARKMKRTNRKEDAH